MAVDETPFHDVIVLEDGVSLPDLKWRELLFIGALRQESDAFVRDPQRPLPRFALPDLFPEGVRFSVERSAGRVLLRRRQRQG
jgi:hypothetical protein